jgi:hypothetical protein
MVAFRYLWSVSAALLLVSTWRLWLPNSDFPQVPVFSAAGRLPTSIDWSCLLVMLGALLAQASRWWRPALMAFVVAMLVSITIDQHRFQPWAYEFLIVAIVLMTADPPNAVRLLRWLVVSIYVYSAWSKCDFTFLHNLGQQFLSAVVGLVGLRTESWPDGLRIALAWLFPLGEVVVAVGLAVPRFWRWGRWASVALHGMLLLVLGPLGLDQRWGVLIWNGYFIGQNLLLFRPMASVDKPALLPRPALVCVVVAIVWPLLEPWGYCDHWPAWSVYAPRVERTSVFVPRGEQHRLSPEIEKYLEPAADDEAWLLVRLDRWSLDTLGAPLYPQNRFQLAVADALARQFGLTQLRTASYDVANRWNGARTATKTVGISQLESATERYLVNARAVRPLLSSDATR